MKKIEKEYDMTAHRSKSASLPKTSLLTKAVIAGTGFTLTLGLGVAPAAASPDAVEDNNDSNSDSTQEDLENVDLKENEELRETTDSGVITEEEEALLSLDIPEEEKEEEEHEANVVISSSDEDRTITIRDKEETVAEALEERDLDLSGYRDEDGERVDEVELKKLVLENEETLFLHSHERTVDTEEVVLEHSVEEVETDELYVDETEVEQEGIDGSALKIELTSGYGEEQTASERLTIISAPQSEVVRVGTKERPENEFGSVYTAYNVEAGEYTPDYTGMGDPLASNEEAGSTLVDENGERIVSGNEIVDTMLSYVGNTPYTWGGTSPSTGFDCSGIIWYAYQQEGISIPRVSGDQGRAGTPVSWDNIQVGDLIWSDSHIGVYAGDGKLVHALNPRVGIRVDSVDSWRNKGLQVSRI